MQKPEIFFENWAQNASEPELQAYLRSTYPDSGRGDQIDRNRQIVIDSLQRMRIQGRYN